MAIDSYDETRVHLKLRDLRDEIAKLLQSSYDNAAITERAAGMGHADLFIEIDGIEYHVQITLPDPAIG